MRDVALVFIRERKLSELFKASICMRHIVTIPDDNL
ncbi:hypothetical protein HALA3H3_p40022 [Halomonas sp. A3H3]|nr:hypothetical protein HALA3H3_p40022 [Halomonas sp. A3H3]